MRPLLPGIAVAAIAAAAAAQGLAWNVPPVGAVTYARTVARCVVDAPPPRVALNWLVPGADLGGHEWRYLACRAGTAPKDFASPSFDDADWLLGVGEFCPEAGTAPEKRTDWHTEVLLLRTKVDLGKRRPKALVFKIHHDDGVRVFGNGKQLLKNDGYGRDRIYVVSGEALDGLILGENVFAVRCQNTGGAQYLDVAIAAVMTLPPGVKSAEDLEKELAGGRQAADRLRADLFGAFRPPGLVLQGELDPAQQRPLQPPGDLREVPFWVACDLSRGVLGGAYSAEVPRLYRLGDLQLRGKCGSVDAEGWQELEVAVKTTPEMAPRGDSKRFLAMFLRPHAIYAFDGRLRVRRRLDLAGDRARVAECECSFEGRFSRGKDWKEYVGDLSFAETYRLTGERDNQDAAFRAEVAQAIDRGTGFLKSKLGDLAIPKLAPQNDDAQRSYHSGRLALGLLALIKGGVPQTDPVLQKGMAALRQRTLVDTYSLGNAIMAIEASYAPASEYADQKHGLIERSQQREVSADDKALLQRWTLQLLDNVDTRVDTGYLLRFNYVRDGRFDHSVNQYGLLGMYSAHLCGVELEPGLWEAAVNHLISSQCAPQGSLLLDLTDFRSLARAETEATTRRTGAQLPIKPAGWHYQEPKDGGEDRPSWGAMTCAGITGLAVCQAALLDAGQKRIKLQNDASAARNAAFGWLAQNMTARYHPGYIDHQQHWYFYYLYGLERAALLSNVARIQGRDWYFEGAMVLTGAQNADGSWPGELHADDEIERAAMAVLFLKKGTKPVLTGQ